MAHAQNNSMNKTKLNPTCAQEIKCSFFVANTVVEYNFLARYMPLIFRPNLYDLNHFCLHPLHANYVLRNYHVAMKRHIAV